MKYFAIIALLLYTVVANGQSHLPLSIVNAGDTILTLQPNKCVVNSVVDFVHTDMNYVCHQYDELSKTHYWAYTKRTEDYETCNAYQEWELQVWVNTDQYYWSYTNNQLKLSVWGGDDSIAYRFRSTIQLPVSYDFNIPSNK